MAVRRFNVTPSLPTLWLLKAALRFVPTRPPGKGPATRNRSQAPRLEGSSTRITSAPSAASVRVAPAPASWPLRSQMRKPSSGPPIAESPACSAPFIAPCPAASIEDDDAAQVLALAHVVEALVDVFEPIGPGDELIDLELPQLVQRQQVRDVEARVP